MKNNRFPVNKTTAAHPSQMISLEPHDPIDQFGQHFLIQYLVTLLAQFGNGAKGRMQIREGGYIGDGARNEWGILTRVADGLEGHYLLADIGMLFLRGGEWGRRILNEPPAARWWRSFIDRCVLY